MTTPVMLVPKHARGEKGGHGMQRGSFGLLGDSPYGANNIPPADWCCAGRKSSEQRGESPVFLCMGQDAAEFTVEQKKRGIKSLLCTKQAIMAW